MKALFTGLFVLVVIASITSCTKTNNIKTTVYDTTIVKDTVYVLNSKNPITGFWVGKYLSTGETDSFYYSVAVRPDGNCITTAIAFENSAAASGPWQLTGTTFTTSVMEFTHTPNTAVKQNITATYDSTAGTLTGSIVVTQGASNPGTFRVFRVN